MDYPIESKETKKPYQLSPRYSLKCHEVLLIRCRVDARGIVVLRLVEVIVRPMLSIPCLGITIPSRLVDSLSYGEHRPVSSLRYGSLTQRRHGVIRSDPVYYVISRSD